MYYVISSGILDFISIVQKCNYFSISVNNINIIYNKNDFKNKLYLYIERNRKKTALLHYEL